MYFVSKGEKCMQDQNKDEAREQLVFIKSIMDDSQRVVADNGTGFIIWGVLILFAGIGTFILEYYGQYQYIGWLYLGTVFIGWLYMAFIHRNTEKCVIGNPITKKIINSIWIAVLISMTILGFFGGATQTIDLNHMTAVMYTVLGSAYFLQGVITGKTWVRNLAFGWWLGAIVLFFISEIPAAILAAAMMIGLQIVPGIIFNRQWKAQLIED
jgi:hypothetical protein